MNVLNCGVARMARWVLVAVVCGVLGAGESQGQMKSLGDIKSILQSELPANALEVAGAVGSAKVGELITIRGHVALSKDAFDSAKAVFTVVDESVRTGARPAPADALPETFEAIPASGRATVRVVNASGAVIGGSLRDLHGLRPGAEVFVTGRVSTANGPDQLVVDMTALHVPRGGGLPPVFFSPEAPSDAKDISEARKAGGIKKGDRVVLRGRVGGSKVPFVTGRAVFTLVGRGLKACNENPDDKCSKPWDYCCETQDAILANSVTVQVVDSKGQVLRTDLKGRRGIQELTEVVVTGTVAVADGKAVVVNATSMWVAP